MIILILWMACTAEDSSPKLFEEHYENGQVSISGQLKNDVPMGTWKEWHANGIQKAEYHFLDGVEHGTRKAWYENAQLAEEGRFKFGIQDGTFTMWFETGQKRAETHYQKGVEHGIRQTWYPNGQMKSEAAIETGLQNGQRRFWHDNGRLKADGSFIMDQLEGLEQTWDKNGIWMESHCYQMNTAIKSWSAATGDQQPPPNICRESL